jgi:hypothetical protein
LVSRVRRRYNAGMAAGPIHEPREHFKLPQFGLRTMFFAMAACGGVFAVMAAIGPVASGAVLLGAAVIGLHVAGNWVGTSLRDSEAKDRSIDVPFSNALSPFDARLLSMRTEHSTPRLCQHVPLSWLNRVLGILGAVAGAVLLSWTGASVAGLVVGSVSSAVVGGCAGFLISSFAESTLTAWWQATSEANSQPTRKFSNGAAEDLTLNFRPPSPRPSPRGEGEIFGNQNVQG